MTTHYVEIRPSMARRSAWSSPWAPLTITPVSKEDADNLCKVIGPHWEARVVPATDTQQMELVRLDLFSLLEAPPTVATRWSKVTMYHHPDCQTKVDDGDHWKTTTTDLLTGVQWVHQRDLAARVVEVRQHIEDLGLEATIRLLPVRLHSGQCPNCNTVARGVSVQAEVVWTGSHRMIREYAL